MFIYTNPPRKNKKAKKPEVEAEAEVIRAVPKRRRKKYKKFSVLTPGGGRLLAANKGSKHAFKSPSTAPSWGSIFSRHLRKSRGVAHSKGSQNMAKRGRRFRLNGTFSLPRQKGLVGNFFKNMVGVTPIIGGVIANGLVTAFLGSKIPYTKQGIGNIALGIATASALGAGTKMVAKNKDLGNGVMIGGIVGTLGCWFQKALTEGLVESLKPGMHGWSDTMPGGFHGMGDFTTPMSVQNALPPQSYASQYSLPMTTAQFVPGAQVSPPPTPAMASQAGHMADYEQGAIGAVLGNETNMGL